MGRIRTAITTFGVNFMLGYTGGSLLKDRKAGIRAGLALGAVGAIGSWRLSGRANEPIDLRDEEPIEIEIDE